MLNFDFLHRDAPRFFEVDCVELSCTETLRLVGKRTVLFYLNVKSTKFFTSSIRPLVSGRKGRKGVALV